MEQQNERKNWGNAFKLFSFHLCVLGSNFWNEESESMLLRVRVHTQAIELYIKFSIHSIIMMYR